MSVNNIEKLLQYLIPVCKSPIRLCEVSEDLYESELPFSMLDFSEYFKPKTKIVLGESFFVKDSCNMCGHCCPPETNLYTQTEYELMNDDGIIPEFEKWNLDLKDRGTLLEGLIPEYYNINGKYVKLYRYLGESQKMYMPKKDSVRDRCHWLVKNDQGNYVCRIHPIVSITCEMPHLRILHLQSTVSIGITQFGRNWALGCDVEFEDPKTEDEFEMTKCSRIVKLVHLNKVAEDMNIDTYLPEIIKYIQDIPYNNYKEFLHRPVVEIHNTRKLFDLNNV